MCIISCVLEEIKEINPLDKERIAVSITLHFLLAVHNKFIFRKWCSDILWSEKLRANISLYISI